MLIRLQIRRDKAPLPLSLPLSTTPPHYPLPLPLPTTLPVPLATTPYHRPSERPAHCPSPLLLPAPFPQPLPATLSPLPFSTTSPIPCSCHSCHTPTIPSRIFHSYYSSPHQGGCLCAEPHASAPDIQRQGANLRCLCDLTRVTCHDARWGVLRYSAGGWWGQAGGAMTRLCVMTDWSFVSG